MFGKRDSNIGRFTRVESWLGRGGQPTEMGYRMLAHYGFRTIVNLRRRKDKLPKDLRDRFEMVHIPVKNHGLPSDEQALDWLHLCAAAANHPIFVHCEAGKGRTSTFMGLVRIAQGYRIDEILTEGIHVYDFPQSESKQIAFLRSFHERVMRGDVVVPAIISEPLNSALTAAATTAV